MNLGWEYPEALLIPMVLLPIVWQARKRRQESLYFSDRALLEPDERLADPGADWSPWPISLRLRLVWVPSALRVTWLSLLSLAAAGPYLALGGARMPRALALVIDASGSMGTIETVSDSGPITRLDQAKRFAERLLGGRMADGRVNPAGRETVSLVTAAKAPDLVAPVTNEWDLVRAAIGTIAVDPIDNRTNLGDAIALAIKSLGPGPPPPALVLLTDGAQNVPGALPLGEAARVAEALEIPIHVVALGSAATSLDPAAFARDRESLRQLAALTRGRLIVLDADSDLPDSANQLAWEDLSPAWDSARDRATVRQPLAGLILVAALTLLFGEILLRATWLRILPA